MAEKLAPYVILEGGSMSGKTTQRKLLLPRLTLHRAWQEVREPGGTIFGDEIRDAVQRHDRPEYVYPLAEFFAYSAARTQLIQQVVLPALRNGVGVLSDRSWFSSFAYQGQTIAKDYIVMVSTEATAWTLPDVVLYFDLLPELAQERVKLKGDLDIHDLKGLDFHRRVRDNYLELGFRYPNFWRTIDASQSVEAVFADSLAVLSQAGIL